MVDVRQLWPLHTEVLPHARSCLAQLSPCQLSDTPTLSFLLKQEENQDSARSACSEREARHLVGEHVLWPQMSFCLAC